MARQSKKSKNELDVILEQLKKSYASDAADPLEDDLLESPTDEDDAELNEILGKIFTYEDSYVAPKTEESPEETVAEADDNTDNTEEPSPAIESTDDTSEVISAEEAEIDEAHKAEMSEAEMLEDEVPLEEDLISEEAADEDDEPASDIDAVDNVLNLMFSKKESNVRSEENHTAIASIIDAPVADEEEICETEHYDEGDVNENEDVELQEIVCEDEEEIVAEKDNEPIYPEEAYIPEVADDDESEADEYVDIADDELPGFDEGEEDSDISEDDPVFAVEDEEYSEYEDQDDSAEVDPVPEEHHEEKIFVPYPVPHIVLTASRYTDDPLQNNLPTLEAIPGLSYLREAQNDTLTESSQKREKAREESFDENDISLLLKFGYHDEIKSKVGEKKTKEVLLEADNTFVPDPTKKIFGYCDKELKSRRQILSEE